jgi:hypothetical protein
MKDKLLTILIDSDLHIQFKLYCVQKGVSMGEQIREWIERATRENN